MNKLILSLCFTMALIVSASAGDNLLKKWWFSLKDKDNITATCTLNKGLMTFKNPQKCRNGYTQVVRLNQKKPQNLKFGGEVKAVNVKGHTSCNFSLYADIELMNGKRIDSLRIDLKKGSFDWKKIDKTISIQEAIKKINFYVLFRNVTGEAQFRNLYLETAK